MIKRFNIISAALIAVVALSGLAVSSASANLALTCYKVSEFKAGTRAGNWENATCTKEVAKLKGEFVLAEPITYIKENLWCAKITPYVVGKPSETGSWANNKCTEKKEDGEYIEVIAEPTKILYKTGSKASYEATSGAGHLVSKNGLELKCKADTASGNLEGENGPAAFKVTFTGCTGLLGVTCTGKGQASGTEVWEGKATYLLMLEGTTLKAGFAFKLSPEVEVECGGVSAKERGCMAGIASPLESFTKKITITLTQSKGVNSVTKILEPGATSEESCILETSENGGAYEQTGEETTETLTLTEAGQEVELMN
jgi:hypothetical protein